MALKFIPNSTSQTEAGQQMVKIIKKVAGIEHAGLPVTIEVMQDGKNHCIVTEFIQGYTIKEVLLQTSLSERQAGHIIN